MMRAFVVAAVGLGFVLFASIGPVGGQAIPKLLQESGPEDIIRQRDNTWTVGVAGGNMDGTYLRFADELGKVLDDGPELRVIPMISRGAAANLEDLLYLRGVDIAFTQADVFEYFRTSARPRTWRAASSTSSASRSPSCMSRRGPTSSRSRTCAARRWCSARPEARRR
jgi:hypothetical protein